MPQRPFPTCCVLTGPRCAVLPARHSSEQVGLQAAPSGAALAQRVSRFVIFIEFAKLPSARLLYLAPPPAGARAGTPHLSNGRGRQACEPPPAWQVQRGSPHRLHSGFLRCELVVLSCFRTIYFFFRGQFFFPFFSWVIGCLFLNFCEFFISLEGSFIVL